MSKKGKKKKLKKYQSEYYRGYHKPKKSKKGKKKDYRNVNNYSTFQPERGSGLKTVHPTLPSKEAKANRNLIEQPVKVPKKFLERRERCNHVGGLISVQAFKDATPSYSAYTPALDAMVAKFGEDNVSVCAQCFDVVVSRTAVTSDDVRDAKLILYAAANIAVSNYRMKKKEVRKINVRKAEDYAAYKGVCRVLDKIQKIPSSDSAGGRDPINALNNIQGSAFVG